MASRDLHLERLYSLGPYKNITFNDNVNDLPLSITLDSEVVGSIRYLQMLSIERGLRTYLDMKERMDKMSPEEELEFLEEQEFATLEKLKKLFNGNLKGE